MTLYKLSNLTKKRFSDDFKIPPIVHSQKIQSQQSHTAYPALKNQD